MKIFQLYNKLLTTHPKITQSTTVCSLMITGDIISQNLIEKNKKPDINRTLRFGLYGLIFVAPVVRKWYAILEKYFPLKSNFNTLKKYSMDQIVFAPVFQASGIICLEAMKFKNIDEIKYSFQNSYYDIMASNYKFWPIAQFINFFVIPYKYRIIFGSTAALFWNTYFTWKINKNQN